MIYDLKNSRADARSVRSGSVAEFWKQCERLVRKDQGAIRRLGPSSMRGGRGSRRCLFTNYELRITNWKIRALRAEMRSGSVAEFPGMGVKDSHQAPWFIVHASEVKMGSGKILLGESDFLVALARNLV